MNDQALLEYSRLSPEHLKEVQELGIKKYLIHENEPDVLASRGEIFALQYMYSITPFMDLERLKEVALEYGRIATYEYLSTLKSFPFENLPQDVLYEVTKNDPKMYGRLSKMNKNMNTKLNANREVMRSQHLTIPTYKIHDKYPSIKCRTHEVCLEQLPHSNEEVWGIFSSNHNMYYRLLTLDEFAKKFNRKSIHHSRSDSTTVTLWDTFPPRQLTDANGHPYIEMWRFLRDERILGMLL